VVFENTLLQRLAQDLQHVAAARRQVIQKEHAVVCQRHFPRQRHVAAADQPDIRDGEVVARKGRVVTKAVRAPVRPATLWRRVVSGRREGSSPAGGWGADTAASSYPLPA
jgi:hypothetical protein